MDINQAFPSRFLKAADLNGRPVRLSIADVTMEKMVNGQIKPAVAFSKTNKLFILNKVNSNVIAKVYGKDTDGWIGREIVLYPTEVEFQGAMVEAIRVRVEQMPARKSPPPAPAPEPAKTEEYPHPKSMKDTVDGLYDEAHPPPAAYDRANELDDEIPF